MSLEENLSLLESQGYRDVSFIAMPNGPQYDHGRTPEGIWVCQTESYPGDPEPLYAWGKTRLDAIEKLVHVVRELQSR